MPNEIFDALAPLVSPEAAPAGGGEPAWVRWLRPVVESPFSAAARRAPGEAALPKLDKVGDNEIAESLAPLVNPGRLQLQEQYLDRARARVKDQGEGVVGYLSKRVAPFASSVAGTIEQQRHADALRRYNAGAADESDVQVIAAAERLTAIDQGRTTLESLGSTAARLPAVLGEAYVGGGVAGRLGLAGSAAPEAGSLLTRAGFGAAVRQAPGAAVRQAALTPAMPSVWLEESAQRAAQQGGDWYDPQNVAPALLHGALQNAVLGSVGKFAGRAPGGLAGRAGVGAAVLPMESAAADVFAGVVDDTVMPDAYKLRTRYGTLGQLARGETDDALKRVVVEALTGAAFSAYHGKDHGPQLAEVKKALDDAHEAGATRQEAAKSVAQLLNRPTPAEPEPGGGVLGRRNPGESTRLTANPDPPVTVTAPPEAPPATTYGDTPPIAPGSPLPRPGPESTPGPAEPPIAPLGGRAARDSALEAAQGHVRSGKGSAVYVDMDVDNAKGLDRAVGGPGPAAEHIRAMVGLVREELAAIPGATAEVFRHAGDPMGDEHSAVVTGATKAQVNEALARARERIGAHAAAAGLHEAPHAKGEGRPAGVGLSTFAEPLEAGRPWKHTVTEAEAGTESVKARRNQPAPPVTMTAVERMRQSQAKKGGLAPRPGATEAGGELRPPPEALAPKQRLALARAALEKAGAQAEGLRAAREKVRPESPPEPAARPTPPRLAGPEEAKRALLASVLENRLAQAHRAVREAVKAGTDATKERAQQAVAAVRRSAGIAGRDADALLAGRVPGWSKAAKLLGLAAPKGRPAASLANLKQNAAPQSLLAYLRTQHGGVSKASAGSLGLDVEAMEQSIRPSPFEDARGNPSRTSIEDVIPRLIDTGDIVPSDREHDHDQLVRRLQENAPAAIGLGGRAAEAAFAKKREAFERARADEPTRPADPLDFPFGENVNEAEFGPAEQAAERMLAAQFAKNAGAGLPEAMGAASFGFTPEARRAVAEHLKASATRFVHGVQDFAGRLGGQIAPTISRFSAAAGNAVARLGSVGHYARLWPSVVLDRVLPAGSGQADRLRVGAAMVEWVLRDIRTASLRESERASDAGAAALRRAQQAATPKEKAAAKKEAAEAFARANEYREKAGKVASVVGGSFKDPSVAYPLPDEASYHAALADPRVRDAIAKHKSEAAPDLIRAFERATGQDSDEFDTLRNFNAMPISLVVPREGEASATAFVPGNSSRGRLGNQSLRRLSASYEATGSSSKGYELDYGKILERMAADRFPLAAKAEAYRTWEKEGVGRWGEPGETNTVDGATWKRMPNVNPPRGSQAAETGQTAFFVDPRFWPEVHQVLGLNEPPGRVPFSSLLSKLTLASTVEAAYHSRNLLTMLTRPGYNPLDTVRHAYRLVLKDPATMKAVLDLAEVGAMKEHGFEAPVFLGKYNPLARFQKATGAFLTVVDRAVRLSAADAFDRVAKRPGVENSERAKRDFINQAGNYSKLTQSRIVAWLRDTGLGPFATAGSNFYVQGLRGLVGSHGVRTTSYRADLKLRAEMLVRMAVLPAVAAAVNYALWGRADGDDKTPLFGLKLGTDAKGKTSYLDLGGLTGVTRGMRETGLQALAESQRAGAKRAGATPSDAFDRGVSDAALALLHPAIGPPVAAVHTALTGKNTLGGQVAPRADLKKGESQAERNLWAALWQTNPVLESYVEPYANRAAGFKERREESLQEKAMKMFGPFGVKTRGEAPGAPHRRQEIPVPASPQQRADQQARRGLAPPRR